MLELWLVPVAIVIIYLFSSIKFLREYERGVVFRLGWVLSQPKGPGVVLVFAPLDRVVRIEIGAENTTVVFPLPIDMMSSLTRVFENLAGPPTPAGNS